MTPVESIGWLVLLGALGAMDGHVFPSFWLSQPLVGGAVCGAVLHDFEAGLLAGAVLQMLWIASLPVGGAVQPDGFLGGMAAAACAPADLHWADAAWLADARLAPAVVVGLAAAYAGRILLQGQRRLQARAAARADEYLQSGDAAALARLHTGAMVLHPVRGALGVLLGVVWAPHVASILARAGVAAPAGRLGLVLAAASLLALGRRRRWLVLPGLVAGGAVAWLAAS